MPPFIPGQAFAELYGLTTSELRVLLAMAPGLGVKEAAKMLGIGENTAKTHLQHIHSKTGTSKQTELVRLLHEFHTAGQRGPAASGRALRKIATIPALTWSRSVLSNDLLMRVAFWCGDGRAGFRAHGLFVAERQGYA